MKEELWGSAGRSDAAPAQRAAAGKMELHCVKSHRPFELFVNENCKLQNEAKMNVIFERASACDPRRSPLSAELNDAST